MRSVMMDRWGLDSAFKYLGGDFYEEEIYSHLGYDFIIYKEAYSKRCTDQCWENFLTAIVLWDEIWSFNRGPFDWKYLFEEKAATVSQYLNGIMHQVDPFMVDEDLLSDYYFLTSYRSGPSSILEMKYEAIDRLYVNSSLRVRTSSYEAISQCLGVPYLAHPFREDSIGRENFSRKDIIEKVDKELEKYYHYMNAKFGRNLYQFRYPVLIDMIKQKASTPEEELLVALEMREAQDVLDFRDAINSIEQAVQSGRSQELIGELEFVSNLAEKITKKHKDDGAKLGEFSISIPFSLSVSFPLPQRFDSKGKYKPQATFIRRLINYGVSERALGR